MRLLHGRWYPAKHPRAAAGAEQVIGIAGADGARIVNAYHRLWAGRLALASLAARLTDLRVAWNGSSLGGFTFSAGVAVLRVNGTVFADLLHAADRALYQAKDAGRNRILVADATSSAS